MILAWVISIVFAAFCGYWFQALKTQVANIKVAIQSKVDKQKVEEAPKSSFIDPDDALQVAQFEFKQTMEKLNPKE